MLYVMCVDLTNRGNCTACSNTGKGLRDDLFVVVVDVLRLF